MTATNVVLVAHDPEWSRKFNAEARKLKGALGTAAREIHHIGSTAIPGILAKPVVDILVEATSLTAIDERTVCVEASGYEAKGEFGIEGRRYFRKNNSEGVREYQVHVFAESSSEVIRHLAFRDYLRSHFDVALQYSELKQSLSKKFPSDVGAYTDAKSPFIRAVEIRALGTSPHA